jgi:hypothetical protein
METVLTTLGSPVVLFFILGLVAAFARSDLAIPEAIAKGLSIYLMMAIGFKGGAQLANGDVGTAIVSALALGAVLSLALPVVAYVLLRATVRLDGAVAFRHALASMAEERDHVAEARQSLALLEPQQLHELPRRHGRGAGRGYRRDRTARPARARAVTGPPLTAAR